MSIFPAKRRLRQAIDWLRRRFVSGQRTDRTAKRKCLRNQTGRGPGPVRKGEWRSGKAPDSRQAPSAMRPRSAPSIGIPIFLASARPNPGASVKRSHAAPLTNWSYSGKRDGSVAYAKTSRGGRSISVTTTSGGIACTLSIKAGLPVSAGARRVTGSATYHSQPPVSFVSATFSEYQEEHMRRRPSAWRRGLRPAAPRR
jgi:hypothetical protein